MMDFINHIDFIEEELEEMKPFHGSSIYDAFIYTYQLYEEVNLEEISRLSSSSIPQVLDELEDHLFLDPYLFDIHHDLQRDYIIDIHYMMGNLYDRYKEAYLMNIKYGGLFEKNLRFLKKYISDLSLKQIIDAKSLFKDEVKKIYQYFNTRKDCYRRNLDLIALLENRDLLYKNHSLKEVHQLIDEYLLMIYRNKGYKHLLGYTLTSFDHDPFYMMLMRKINLIVETDAEKRINQLLLSACSLLLHHIQDEVTIIVNANVKRMLLEMKHQLYPNLKGIDIICAHEFKGNEKYIIYDCSSQYHLKIIKYMSSLKSCAFFLDNLVDHNLIETFVHYFINEKEIVYKGRYENGFIINSADYNSLSFLVKEYENHYRLFQQLSPYLTFHDSLNLSLSSERYDNSIHHLDVKLCIGPRDFIDKSYFKRHCLSMYNDPYEPQENCKYFKILENIYLYACYEYESQLVYCDHYDLDDIKDDLIKIGMDKNDIQIISPRSTYKKNCKVYLAKTNSIYPFQIRHLKAIHHMDLPETLHQLYSRNASIKQYIYIVKESIDSYVLQKLFYDALLHDEYHHDFTLSKSLYYEYKSSFHDHSLATNQLICIQNKRLEDKFYMIDTKKSIIETGKISYPLLNLTHLTRYQKRAIEKKINDFINCSYFNKKERYMFTLGNYQVYLPQNMLKQYPYLLLISDHVFIYPIVHQHFYIKDLILFLKEKEETYEENEYRAMSRDVRELI